MTGDHFLVAALAAPLLVLALLTGAGSRRRGAGWLLAGFSGALFPLTWVVWYVKDDLPHVRDHPTV